MTASEHTQELPRPLLLSAALLVLAAIGMVAIGDDLPQTGLDSDEAIVTSYEVRLHTLEDGSVLPILADGTRLSPISADKAGFVTGVMRGLSRGRKLSGSDPDAPYRVARLRDGRLLLTDTATGTSINLDVFGSDNARTFAKIWQQGEDRAAIAAR